MYAHFFSLQISAIDNSGVDDIRYLFAAQELSHSVEVGSSDANIVVYYVL